MGFELSLKINGIPSIKNLLNKGVNKELYNSNGVDLTEFFFQALGSGNVAFKSFTDKTGVTWYKDCPPLSLITTRKNIAFNEGKFLLHDVTKAEPKLVENPNNPIYKLTNSPNPLQTGEQFRAAVKTIYEYYGVCYVYKIAPLKEFGDSTVSQLWILPNQYVDVKWNTNYLGVNGIHDMIDSIKFGEGTKSEYLNKDDVYLFTDLTVSLVNQAIPQSRLEGVKSSINNIIKNQATKAFIIENRGAQGILSNEGTNSMGNPAPMDNLAKEQLQKEYKSQYGLSKGQWDLIITSLPLKYQQMGYNPKDLMLQEFMKDDVTLLCAALGYRYALLFDNDTTFNNQEQYRKDLYTSSLIPEGRNFATQWNECSGANKAGLLWSFDWSHIDCLQADKKSAAEIKKQEFIVYKGLFKNCAITYGRFVEAMGEHEGIKEWQNKYWKDLTPEQRAIFDDTTISETQAK